MISAQIIVALTAAPGDREAGDQAAWEGGAFMTAQHRGADAIDVMPTYLAVERAKLCLPGAPANGILLHLPVQGRLQARADAERRLRAAAAEAESQPEFLLGSLDLRGKSDIAVRCAVELFGQ